MTTAGIFHDSEVKKVERVGDVIDLRIKADDTCYINMKLIGVVGECNIETNYAIDTSEIVFEDGYYIFLADCFRDEDSSVKCQKILWNIEVILPPYLRTHDCYPDISALYEDISLEVDNAELKDGKLIINAEDRTEVELKNGEYIITVNGKREKGSVEDQDIYFYLLGLIFTPDRTKILWQFSRCRIVSILYDIMNFFIVAALGFFAIAIGVITENAVLLIICPIVALIIFFAALVVMGVVHSRLTYKIHDSGLSGGKFEYLPFSDIENVELKPSRIFKKRATIKLTANGKKYYLRFITGANEAYAIIKSHLNAERK